MAANELLRPFIWSMLFVGFLCFMLSQGICGQEVECVEGEYACANGLTCIPEELRCDYIADCDDNSDEVDGCRCDPSIEFNCTIDGCINVTWVCNGEADCFDGSDERAELCGFTTETTTSERRTYAFTANATTSAAAYWRPWSSWSPCSSSCGVGTKTRARTCSDSGGCTGYSRDSVECNTQRCPYWSLWSSWSPCIVSCGGGTKTRARTCSHSGGCSGSSRDSDDCNAQRCSYWRPWSSWGPCSNSCGGGSQTRARTCSVSGGCSGSSRDSDDCNTQTCYCSIEDTQLSLDASVTIQSPGYPTYYTNNVRCEWTVTPTAMRRVQGQFIDFRLEKNFDFVYVGTINTSRALVYTGHETPDARIISPINESLLFEFTTDGSITDKGFSLLVTDVEDGDYALCQNSSDIITCYWNLDCPNQETHLSLNDSVTIHSPGYPLPYEDNIRCEWTVTPSAMRRVHVQFMDFQLEDGFDLLYIGTVSNPGALLYTGQLGNGARIISPINEGLLFQFITDESITDQGFSSLITDVEDEDYALCENGLEINQESFKCYAFHTGCPNEETLLSLNETVTIQSHGYPLRYQNNIRCEWTVTPSAMRRVHVIFLDFQLEYSFDVLYVGTISNPSVLSYTGQLGNGARIISPINQGLLFQFTTDYSVTNQGFALLITDVEDEEYVLCQNGLEIIQESFKCYGCPNNETRLSLNESVIIQSPGYPVRYENNIGCEWTVTPTAMRRAHVQFLDFELEPGFDFLYVGTDSNPRALVYTGDETPDTRIISPINETLLFEFTAGSNSTGKRFSLLVADVEDGDYALCKNISDIITCYEFVDCPSEETHLSLNESVTIHSPGYPLRYGNNIGCKWTVTPSAMRRVQVQFLDFNLQNGFDFLYIGTVSNEIAHAYTGFETPGVRIISPINEGLLFKFTTNDRFRYQGFSLLVTDVEDGEYALCQNSFGLITCYENIDCPKEETQLSLNESVTTQSLGYPKNYMNNITCEWIIKPSAMRRVHVQFLDFQLEPGYDFLYVGPISNPRALNYTGYQGYETQDADIISPINEGLLFEFTTDHSVTGQGFSLLVTDVEDEESTCGLRTIFLDSSTNMTSPGFPDPYRPNLDCQWVIIADNKKYESLIVARLQFFELEKGFDYLTVGNGRVARKNAITELTGVLKVRTITSSTSSMWFALKTDSTGNKLGYRLELEHIRVSAAVGVCKVDEYHCGSGFCVTSDAECDGFVDCYVNKADENRCANIKCPGSHLCDEVPGVNISKCVTMEDVCDGQIGCPGGDDEIQCDINRCPDKCSCAYHGNDLQIDCNKGWSKETITSMARTVNALKLTGGLVSGVEPGLFKRLFALHTL
ncbi:cubilin-like [Amphiura filiformis]|uniref:cubilin-like n=1 Tax=Amphiura filiformis TaxID=82378 RepID=UPI003B224B4B